MFSIMVRWGNSGKVLKHQADAAVLRGHVKAGFGVGDEMVFDDDAALLRSLESGAARRSRVGFSATGGAKQTNEFARLHGE